MLLFPFADQNFKQSVVLLQNSERLKYRVTKFPNFKHVIQFQATKCPKSHDMHIKRTIATKSFITLLIFPIS